MNWGALAQKRLTIGLDRPKLTESQKKDLDCPKTGGEIVSVIKGMLNGEAPGPYGFTAEFFKLF